MAFNLTLPEGTTNHGNANLICTPARWYDILLFFVANYFAHAATVVPRPGQGMGSMSGVILLALLLPSSAINRAILAIARRSSFETKNPLRRAARAGALCMVVKRGEWPVETWSWRLRRMIYLARTVIPFISNQRHVDEEHDIPLLPQPTVLEGSSTLPQQTPRERSRTWPSEYPHLGVNMESEDQPRRHWWEPTYQPPAIMADSQIDGKYWLHEDYYLASVPPSVLISLKDESRYIGRIGPKQKYKFGGTTTPSSQNLLKLSISLVQTIWATVTIYRSRGDQIEQYGYAAFGLTVVQYAYASLLNTLANMTTPEYPCIFVIRTPTMTNAEMEGKAYFDGAIPVEFDDRHPASNRSDASKSHLSQLLDEAADDHARTGVANRHTWYTTLFFSMVPLMIVGGLSGFQKGHSSPMERVLTLSWLVIGMYAGTNSNLNAMWDEMMGKTGRHKYIISWVHFLALLILWLGVPVIGGMVMVGKMLREYGNCTLIG